MSGDGTDSATLVPTSVGAPDATGPEAPEPPPLRQARIEGRRLHGDRFEVVDVIGAGGMGVVARAWDHRDGCWRAAKLLAPALSRYASIVARFEREAQLLGRLGHPGLVRVHATGRDDAYHWLVMDLVDGRTLDVVVREGGVSPGLAVDATLGICAALDVAHRAGVVHRDVKPANVAVTADGQVRLLDFGIARLADADVALTRTGRTMGSHGFMAPEQLVDAKHVDARADVYATAATLLALILGRNPAPGEELLEAAAGCAPDPLLIAVARATATEPARRTPSISKLARQLRRVREDLPTLGPLTSLHRPLPPATR